MSYNIFFLVVTNYYKCQMIIHNSAEKKFSNFLSGGSGVTDHNARA